MSSGYSNMNDDQIFRFRPPTPGGIKAAREAIGDSMEGAAARVHTDRTTWWRWETGSRAMPLAAWELYLIKARRVRRKRWPRA